MSSLGPRATLSLSPGCRRNVVCLDQQPLPTVRASRRVGRAESRMGGVHRCPSRWLRVHPRRHQTAPPHDAVAALEITPTEDEIRRFEAAVHNTAPVLVVIDTGSRSRPRTRALPSCCNDHWDAARHTGMPFSRRSRPSRRRCRRVGSGRKRHAVHEDHPVRGRSAPRSSTPLRTPGKHLLMHRQSAGAPLARPHTRRRPEGHLRRLFRRHEP